MLAQTNWLSKPSVHRVLQLFALRPHRSRRFKLSTDPFFVEKVRDVVGLNLNPPDHALALSADEKSQIQALDRTLPVLPMGLSYVEGMKRLPNPLTQVIENWFCSRLPDAQSLICGLAADLFLDSVGAPILARTSVVVGEAWMI